MAPKSPARGSIPERPVIPGPALEGRMGPFRSDGTAEVLSTPPTTLPGALPGEQVLYRVLGQGAHRAFGQLQTVLTAHPDRLVPPCGLQTVCGSCDWMMLQPSGQMHYKQLRLRTALEPLLNAVPLPPLVASPLSLGYRRRARFVVGPRAASPGMPPPGLQLGVWQSGSHQLLDVEDCPVTAPVLLRARDVLQTGLERTGFSAYDEATGQGLLRAVVLQTDHTGETVLAMVVATQLTPFPDQKGPALSHWQAWANGILNDHPFISGFSLNLHPEAGNRLAGHEILPLAGRQSLTLSLGDISLEVPAGAFSQVNLEVAGLLYQQASEWALAPVPARLQRSGLSPVAAPASARGAAGSPPHAGGLLDLFCGVGGLSLQTRWQEQQRRATGQVPSPPAFTFTLGIESHPGAVKAAQHNAARLGFSDARYQAGPVQTLTPQAVAGRAVAVALVNPPRAGLGKEGLEALRAVHPQRIVYVSCNPESLARDLLQLQQTGYWLVAVQGYDMFPHTHHLETLVWLEADA